MDFHTSLKLTRSKIERGRGGLARIDVCIVDLSGIMF